MALKKKEIDDLLRRASKKQLEELRARLDEAEPEADDAEPDDAPSPHPYAEAYSRLRYGSPLDELRRLDRRRRRASCDDIGGGADAQPPDNVFTISHLRGGR